jgi:acetyl-CoA C-acetyltransferase
MTNINSWSYEDAPSQLCNHIGIKPKKKIYLSDGGNTPQMLINRAAKTIERGKCQAILITGAEAHYSAFKRRSEISHWPAKKEPLYMEGKIWDGINVFENKYGLKYPPLTYALFETAIRAFLGNNIEEHRTSLGKLFEKFSKIASLNPSSWIRKFFTSKEIINIEPDNRIIVYPYTKRMCSNVFVDQSASLILTNVNIAKECEISQKLWVYVMGGADLRNVHEITCRQNLYDSPAARVASKLALCQAGLSLDDITAFDLYSCFPSIVEILMKEIGISNTDPRDLTVTGGLPYFGGPWSNYSLHAVVNAVLMIRKNPFHKIMIVANGGYNTKQSVGIYGKSPPKFSWSMEDNNEIQSNILNNRLKNPIEKAEGILEIEAYTITYDRTGNPKEGIIIGTLENGHRTVALLKDNPEILNKLEDEKIVGRKLEVKYDKKIDRNVIISRDFDTIKN